MTRYALMAFSRLLREHCTPNRNLWSIPAQTLLLSVVICGFAATGRADAATVTVANNSNPIHIRPAVVALPANWSAKLPPSGRVNAPDFLATVYPGQQIAFGLVAGGADRDALLQSARGKVHVKVLPSGAEQVLDLKPPQVRQIKAEGADFALIALMAAGIKESERTKLQTATSLVSLAVFTPAWTVSESEPVTAIEISLELQGQPAPLATTPLLLPIKTDADWLREPIPDQEAAVKNINRHRGNLAPGQLLGWFQAAVRGKTIQVQSLQSYFALYFKTDTQARATAIKAFPRLDHESQTALLRVFRLGGLDLRKVFPDLPSDLVARYDPVAPLPDPRQLPQFQDPVAKEEVSRLGNVMDICWAGWMATGDQSYLRALVGLLENARDFREFQTWQKNRGGEKGLNARVARGLGDQIAGWSIRSFQRTDPLVADWLYFWQEDPATSETIRQEITALPNNSAFTRK